MLNVTELFVSLKGVNHASEQSANFNSQYYCMVYAPATIQLSGTVNTACIRGITYFGVVAVPPNTQSNTINLFPSYNNYFTVITGKINSCSTTPFKGRAELVVGAQKYSAVVENGEYRFNVVFCTLNAVRKLTVYDENDNVVLPTEDIEFVSGRTNQLADKIVCSKATNGTLSITLDGQTYNFSTAKKDTIETLTLPDLLSGKTATVVHLRSADKAHSFYITFVGTTMGNYSVYTCGLNFPGKPYYMSWWDYEQGKITVDKYKSGLTLIEGSFKTYLSYSDAGGAAPPNLPLVITATGSFKMSYE